MFIDQSSSPYSQFSHAEYERRYGAVRAAMRERGLDCLLIAGNSASWNRSWANIRYLSGFVGSTESMAYLVFPLEGEPTIVSRLVNVARARDRCVLPDARGALNYVPLLLDRFRELGLGDGIVGLVGIDRYVSLPHSHFELLRRDFPRLRFEDATSLMLQARAIKSAEEIAYIERAAELTDVGIRSMIERVRPGMTEREVFAIAQEGMMAAGAEHPFMIIMATTSMARSAAPVPYPYPTGRIVDRGDVIINELAPKCDNGYGAQCGKPIALGPVNPAYRDLFAVALEAYQRIADALRPGNTEVDILQAGRVIEKSGYVSVAPFLHGYGLIQEDPIIGDGPDYSPVVPTVFQPGMVLVVEAGPCLIEKGMGLHLGDTFVVTDGAARCLNKYPPVFAEI